MEALLDKANPNQGPGRKYNLFCCSCPKANKRDDASGAAALDRASSIHGDGSLLLLLLLGTLQAPPEWEAGLSYCPSPGLAESASKQPGKSSVSSVGNSTRQSKSGERRASVFVPSVVSSSFWGQQFIIQSFLSSEQARGVIPFREALLDKVRQSEQASRSFHLLLFRSKSSVASVGNSTRSSWARCRRLRKRDKRYQLEPLARGWGSICCSVFFLSLGRGEVIAHSAGTVGGNLSPSQQYSRQKDRKL